MLHQQHCNTQCPHMLMLTTQVSTSADQQASDECSLSLSSHKQSCWLLTDKVQFAHLPVALICIVPGISKSVSLISSLAALPLSQPHQNKVACGSCHWQCPSLVKLVSVISLPAVAIHKLIILVFYKNSHVGKLAVANGAT